MAKHSSNSNSNSKKFGFHGQMPTTSHSFPTRGFLNLSGRSLPSFETGRSKKNIYKMSSTTNPKTYHHNFSLVKFSCRPHSEHREEMSSLGACAQTGRSKTDCFIFSSCAVQTASTTSHSFDMLPITASCAST